MIARDLLKLASQAVFRARMRSAMMLLAMAIGVAAVVVLTALGEGARGYVTGEFRSLGTNLLIVFPGRSETTGGGPALFSGETPRDLTLDDAEALLRLSSVEKIAPIVIGSAGVQYAGREREVPIFGSTSDLLTIRHWTMAQGTFLPPGESERARPVCVIGAKVKRELFGIKPAIGRWVRIGDRRFRVIGILASEGRAIGIDVQDLVIVPVASAMALFDSASLFRILVQARTRDVMPAAKKGIVEVITQRHQGEEDVTVVTQDAVLATFDRIFNAMTMTLAGIASISLAVAGILIMNVMLVAVSQRTDEVGLLKAIGARKSQITALFLTEALILSATGAAIGLIVGQGASWLARRLYPVLLFGAPGWALGLAVGIAIASGLIFGILPARRAAQLDPVEALAGHKG